MFSREVVLTDKEKILEGKVYQEIIILNLQMGIRNDLSLCYIT